MSATPAGGAARRSVALVAAAVAAALVLAGCTPSHRSPQGGSATTLASPSSAASSAGEPASQERFSRFYDQSVTWSSCGTGGIQCAQVTVPVDWSAPAGATLQLALDRYRATGSGQSLGSIVFDPGGPGGSGVDYVRETRGAVVSPAVAARYDVVGLDPRGVGSSAPVECLSDAQLDTRLSQDVDPDTAAGQAELVSESVEFAQGCAARAGALLGHVGTVDVARDLDVIRAVLGQSRLDYLGASYGTLLGAVYAGMFPHRVGRLVLDGALNPASSYSDVSLLQAKGLEASLRTYAEQCSQRSACPLSHDTDTALGQIRTLIAKAGTSPLPTGTSRPLTRTLATSGVITPLYSDQSWPVLDQALAMALRGNGAGLLRLADLYADRNTDGTYASNLLQANIAVDCLDYPVDASAAFMKAEEARLEAVSPTFGQSLAYGEVQCSVWPDKPTRTPAAIAADGAAPILVVGNTGDPVTPYPWAKALASQLSSGRLLTWHGQGHTSYRRGSTCVDDAVDGYLLRGVLPGAGATCSD